MSVIKYNIHYFYFMFIFQNSKNQFSSSLKDFTYAKAHDPGLHLPLQGVLLRMSFAETGGTA